jgi:hypothetical protein
MLVAGTNLGRYEIPLNYNRLLLFHGGHAGSIPVRDATKRRLKHAHFSTPLS